MNTINDNRKRRGLPPLPGGDLQVHGEQWEVPEQTRDGGNPVLWLLPADEADEKRASRHLIEIAFMNIEDRDLAYAAIEHLLGEMGQIGTLSARTEL